jgi:endonuclease YncB( thermonuclease family)
MKRARGSLYASTGRLGVLALALAAGQGMAAARPLEGTVVRVSDGDTLWLQPGTGGGKPVKLRLQGLDAPERCQPGGARAREALAARVLGRRVQVEAQAIDDYGRTVGTMRLDGEDIGGWLVLQGHAWSDGFRHGQARYAGQEAQARAARRGLFADASALDPRQFRKQHGPCD